MKKLLLPLAAGIVLCSCGSHDPQIAIVPYPNHLETGRGTYRVTDRPVTCDSRTDERTQRAVVGFAARLATVTGGTNPVTVADEVPASGIRFVTDESLPAEGYEPKCGRRSFPASSMPCKVSNNCCLRRFTARSLRPMRRGRCPA